MEKNTNYSDFTIKDGRIYLWDTKWLEEGCKITIISAGLDGSDVKSFDIDLKESSYLSWMNPDGQGNFYFIYDEYSQVETDTEDGEWRDDYYLLKLDDSGREVWKQSLNQAGQEYWVEWMHLLADGRIAISEQDGITFL